MAMLLRVRERLARCPIWNMKKLLAGVICLGVVFFLATAFLIEVRGAPILGYSHIISDPIRNFFKPQKMLIYICVENQGCAGWSDRQKSIVSMFLLALVTNRRFGILLQTPCDVGNFYVPNQYNWIVNKQDLEGRQQRLIYPADNLSMIDFNQTYPEDVLFGRVNSDCFWKIRANPHFKSLLPSWAKRKYPFYFYSAWNILMKPSPKVQLRLERFLKSVNYHNRSTPLVGVHMRMGKNPSNPQERHVFNNISTLDVVWKRVALYVKNGSQVFVASDSAEVRNLSRQRFGRFHHDSAGIIMHVGKQRHDKNACQGFEDAIVDQLFLSYCDVLFKSRGGFAFRASLMTSNVKRVYHFQDGKLNH